jgi:hypothetical protein
MSNFGGKKEYKTEQQTKKRDYSKVNPIVKKEEGEIEPECLIIPGLGDPTSGSTDLVLMPCGEVLGCILYVEVRDPQVLEDGLQEHGVPLEE